MSKESNNNGIGFSGLLLVAFIVLKLAKIGVVADWSWWWVMSPFWIPLCIWLILALIAVIVKRLD
jgi:hypothetical protein